jgi:hypothetical protein
MEPLFDAIIKHIPPPRAHAGKVFNCSSRIWITQIIWAELRWAKSSRAK